MADKVPTIFFDESGNTGPDLLNTDSPTFTIGSVEIEEDSAESLVKEAMRRFSLQGEELKGRNLIGKRPKTDAILFILESIKGRYSFSLCHKKFFLALHIFEYLFEPIISDVNYFLYQIELNKFIVNMVYAELMTEKEVMDFGWAFFQMMRSEFPTRHLEVVLRKGLEISHEGSPSRAIAEIALANIEDVRSEHTRIENAPILNRWHFDPTVTVFHALICHWGQRFPQIKVFYDNSKIITDHRDSFNWVNYPAQTHTLGDRVMPITANLAAPIQEIDSKQSYGIQLADVVATISNWSFVNPEIEEKFRINQHLGPHIIQRSIVPELEEFSASLPKNKILQALFVAMAENVRNGRKPQFNLGFYYELAVAAVESGEI